MKKILILSAALAAAAAIVWAASPTYTTKSGNTGTVESRVTFVPTAGNQIRLVSVIASSDKAASVLSFRSGTGAYVLTATNAAGGTNVYVSSVTGLASNDIVLLVKSDGTVSTNCTVWGVQNSTNIQLTAAVGVAGAIGDEIYEMGAATTIGIGATSNKLVGAEAVFVGNPSRPVTIYLDGTSYSKIDAASARYD